MAKVEDVPANRVGEIIQSYIDDGKTNVTAKKQSDGKWTITAN